MKCPHCSHPEDHVIDSRPVENGNVIRRRRECLSCARRFTTYERLEIIPLTVLKSDNRRQPFDRAKLVKGVRRACQKRPVTTEQIERLVTEVESALQEDFVLEVPSRVIGEMVMAKLKDLDSVAYIRFASVYKSFNDVDTFINEVRGLKQERKLRAKKVKFPDLLSTFLNGPALKN